MRLALFASLGLAVAGVSTAPAANIVRVVPHTGEVSVLTDLPRPKQKASPNKFTIPGGATFNITYQDVGSGFNDPTLGAGRRAVLEAVLTYVGTTLDVNGVCDILVETSQSDGTGALAAAGTYRFENDGYAAGFAFEHLTNGAVDPDLGNNLEDIFVQVDFGYVWNNTTGPVSVGQFDLYSVLLHEVTHGLGIASLSASNGSSVTVGTLATFDNQLHAVGGAKLWDASLVFAGVPLTGGDNTIEFRGLNAQADYSNGVTFPRINTPASFLPGTSMAHWQPSAPTPSTAVMVPAISPNTERRVWHPFEIGALEDLGYSVARTQDWNHY